jgi:hypothetical protein
MQAVASEYFLSARGYNINQLEDPTPKNFMNLKSYNSHEHTPYPPSDLKTVVDLAASQGKWFNLVLHSYTNDDGAINYAGTRNLWGTSIGSVVKYILQRDRLILKNFNLSSSGITFAASRLAIPSTAAKNFEQAFSANDIITLKIDIDDNRTIENVYIDGTGNSYHLKTIGTNVFLLTNILLYPGVDRNVEIRYIGQSTPLISAVPNSVNFTGTQGGTVPSGQTINITNSGTSAAINWSITENIPWLSASPQTGSTPGSVLISVDQTGLNAGSYNGTITITSPDASNSPQNVNVTFTVNSAPIPGSVHYDFSYPNRSSLLADGWDFIAVTPTGGSRNTEQTSSNIVSYDQSLHPGVLRIPTDVGDLWA